MVGSDFKLLLIPVGLAVAFLLWVIWELEKQIRSERQRSNSIAQVKHGMDYPPSGGVAADEQLPSGVPSGFRVAVH